MERIKENLTIIIMIILAIAICVGAMYFMEFNSFTYYTQIDNSKIQELSISDDMKYKYTLDCYNEKGKKKEISFKTSRQLRESAFLKLKVITFTGVNSWEEVQYEELPDKVKVNYNE